MKLSCPKKFCQNSSVLQKDGTYFRKSDSKTIQRYRCKKCGKRFSTARLSACFNQNKRPVNHLVGKLYCSKVSIRRIAKLLRVDKKTVQRKIAFLGIQAKLFNQRFVHKQFQQNVTHMQMDDLITKEKTKMLPLSISLACDANTRMILGFKVSQIAAFGHLAQKSRQKYGPRKSRHRLKLHELMQEITPLISERALIRTDEHQFYPEVIKKYLPNSQHQRFKGGKGSISGQGEMKKLTRDPLFAINHTFAMLRDNISRLVRRSWCVTQKVEILEHHLHIYMKFHNTQLV